eukprot:CAMPEP_0119261716 /NCGR_PEP_ID=MMETSP1329-20130426/1677_1 /TAXON_ID=114041 /ORGANISM="Genus nov. species nov., Strain RCC1024" /LENGTH=126 /DNA_ID=CAMNT_0007261295 /DNA_START=184 /DNA_END=561 /DNA_ORIENTATION=+
MMLANGGRRSPDSVALTPGFPDGLEEIMLRREARLLAAALAARGLRERMIEADRRRAGNQAAAAARRIRLESEVLEEQRSRSRERGSRPVTSPLSNVRAGRARPSPRRRRPRGGASRSGCSCPSRA